MIIIMLRAGFCGPGTGPTSKQVAMEGRVRLAQSLKRHSSFVLWPRLNDWRSMRVARRWGHALVGVNVPRGLGSSAAALLLLGSVSYGVVRGGHGPQIIENVHNICDTTANRLGFRISEIALAGEGELRREEILVLAGITDRSSLLFLDAARTRARLLSNPWIAEATVLKLYPDRLRIEIRERKPFALWQKEGRIALIAVDGVVLENNVRARFADLPRVVGKGAGQGAQDFLALIGRYPAIARVTEASILVAERRWNLRLKHGVEILLPENEVEQALRILVDLDRNQKLLSRDVIAIDLRLPDRITVRQSDAASFARKEALKEAEKAKKARSGRGGEA